MRRRSSILDPRFSILVLTCLLLNGCSGKPTPETITIGHVVSLTGPDKARGEQARRGILLAVEEVNDPDVLVGGRRIEVLHADYGEDKKAITGDAVRLIKINKVSALVGGTDLAEAQALSDVAKRYQVPLVIAAGKPEEVPSDYVFHTGIRPAEQAHSLAKFAKEELKAKTVGILSDLSPNSLSGILIDVFSKEFKHSFPVTAKWVSREIGKRAATSDEESEFKNREHFKEIVNHIRDKNYDAIVFDGAPLNLVRLRKAGLDEKLIVLFAGEEGDQEDIQAVPSAGVVYLATAFAPEDSDETVKKFVQKFHERFQQVPDVHAVLAYDNARLLFQGLGDVKQLDSLKIKEALEKEETFEGITGQLKVNAKDRWYSRPILIVRIVNGKAELVKKY